MNFVKQTLVAACLLGALPVYAAEIGVGVKVGTTGSGLDLSYALSPTVSVRASLTNLNGESFEESFEITNNGANGSTSASFDATADIDFGTTGILLDWYVTDSTFHITAGMIKNDTSISFDGAFSNATVDFDGVTYNVTQDFSDPSMTGEVSFGDSYEPYIGFGWGHKGSSTEPGFSFTFELGVMLLSPSVNLVAPQLKLNDNTTTVLYTQVDQDNLNADVDDAEAEANDDLSDLEMWPVLTIGLNYAF